MKNIHNPNTFLSNDDKIEIYSKNESGEKVQECMIWIEERGKRGAVGTHIIPALRADVHGLASCIHCIQKRLEHESPPDIDHAEEEKVKFLWDAGFERVGLKDRGVS